MEPITIFIVILFIGLGIYSLYILNKPRSSSSINAINPFIEQVDSILGNYIEYSVIHKLREDIVTQLKNAYNQSPKEFNQFAKSTDKRLWAYKYICSMTLNELGTGRYHIYDVLKPEGNILREVNIMCLKSAYEQNYISKEELDEALKSLDDQIREVGTWA
jgi:hypothetical protein